MHKKRLHGDSTTIYCSSQEILSHHADATKNFSLCVKKSLLAFFLFSVRTSRSGYDGLSYMHLENRTATIGGYTGAADSVRGRSGARPPQKCRTAAACQYAVKASAGNEPVVGAKDIQWIKEL